MEILYTDSQQNARENRKTGTLSEKSLMWSQGKKTAGGKGKKSGFFIPTLGEYSRTLGDYPRTLEEYSRTSEDYSRTMEIGNINIKMEK